MAPKAKAKATTRSGTTWQVRLRRETDKTAAAEARAVAAETRAVAADARAVAAEARAVAAEARAVAAEAQPQEALAPPSAAQLLTVLGDMGRDQASIVVTRLKAMHRL
jgi:colicin import membrane protein